ncbi:PREDICTED: probable serine/threonine-protein kinase CST [Lupinus angustifolius]|uniref:probable serine/threonine-protein kinase CST n=1 Tax=Lupinus angustifolius TaxID=3871 RepID=UPI00092EFAA0|nr:PREDICTED: probable serine/threonine-protein kinase CST [Lupinus angustifolius]
MGNCCSIPNHDPHPPTTNQSGSRQFVASVSNTKLSQNGNSTSLGCGNNSGQISHFFGPSSSNNTSTSLWGSENSQVSRTREEEEFPNGQILDVANLTVFTLAELRAATKNFRRDNLLGEGGFGRVYRGRIKERIGSSSGKKLTVAIKVLNSDSIQGFEEWQTEVNFLGRLPHPNLVKLLGFGREGSKLFLVYEYMKRRSLDNHIFGSASVKPLSWDTRLKIMIGAAKGLAFLHTLENRIIYRDLKPSNILLDMTYTAKLADFGLAKSIPYPHLSHVTTRIKGTSGYAAPEYLSTGHLYVKSDVYAFGIVLLEMLTGSRIRDIMHVSQPQSLQNWVKSTLLNRVKIKSTMDSRLKGKYPQKLASAVARISYKCIQTDVKVRPSMVEVVETLEKIEAANEKPADSMKQGLVPGQSNKIDSQMMVN